jgi:asparagine synthase (glutamine-hydrolysing)
MCGIGGILSFGAPPTLATLRAMGHAMAHRGPDGFGHQLLGPCGLTHRRLSIIDLSSAGRAAHELARRALLDHLQW